MYIKLFGFVTRFAVARNDVFQNKLVALFKICSVAAAIRAYFAVFDRAVHFAAILAESLGFYLLNAQFRVLHHGFFRDRPFPAVKQIIGNDA